MAYPRIIFVLGGPGSGKGTQCKKLIDTYPEFVHLSAGELLREARNSGSEVGEMIEKCIIEGSIVPAEVTVGLLRDAMVKNGWEKRRFLIDGFPRNDDNYDVWFRILPEVPVECCLFLDCDDQVLVNRILGRSEGRSDDNIETLNKRLRTYKECTQPIIKRFGEAGKLATIDALGDVEMIFNRVKTALSLE
ncbi:hypothetical protein SteCoe_20657 [Stentor coeruleus]|uniref:UMP/CMP kinase n=1 Tax=Stentor coeruleus TaxID=5963 RepID=A0A1R2BRD5_9CILI|nr:hypothetical protein SteCoe_20657 [Stentor coeruleus]